jgi:hypothetical protein
LNGHVEFRLCPIRTFEFENDPAVKKMMEDRDSLALEEAAEAVNYKDGSDKKLGRVMGDDENDFDEEEEEGGRDEL